MSTAPEPSSPPDRHPALTELPGWYPGWAGELADLFLSGAASFFVLHGNVYDLTRGSVTQTTQPGGASTGYGSLADFLANDLFGGWDVVLHYDLARGLRPLSGNAARLQRMIQVLTPRLGERSGWPRDPETVLLTLEERLIKPLLVETDPARRFGVALLIEYAQYLAPAGDPAGLGRAAGTNLVRFLHWAQYPYIKRLRLAFCLIADKLGELNARLTQNPHVVSVAVPMPDTAERQRFCRVKLGEKPADDGDRDDAGRGPEATERAARAFADMSNGLSLLALNTVLARHRGNVPDPARFKAVKKTLIERNCLGLLEFIEPSHTLDLVAGQHAAKERLRQDAAALTAGRLELAPMGYLLCGPVGTGKTFLAECYAGSIGIPCVTLKNFRSKYVGETESNLEQVLNVLRSLGPVVVVIDEADAALGTRRSDGDGGTSSRVFSMIAAQMGDTRYRGRIIWMLLTSRPDLLPIDLKRQGRAEVHIPLFYPQDAGEFRDVFAAMSRKHRLPLAPDAVPDVPPDRRLSGADIESVLLAARRRSVTDGRPAVTPGDVAAALAEFLPSAQGLEKELQELAAVLESTQVNFLPREWQLRLAEPDGRQRIQERYVAVRRLVEAV